jgi:hypothetical protein
MAEPERSVILHAYCNICHKSVSALTLLGRDDLIAALKGERDVRVMHLAAEGDHVWSLNSQDKRHLSDAITKGLA